MNILNLFTSLILFKILCLRGETKNNIVSCGKGEVFVENECNFCRCREGSLGICTTMAWFIKSDDNETLGYIQNKSSLIKWAKSLKRCNTETKWMKKCNKCWCVSDVNEICEHKKCNVTQRNKKEEKYKNREVEN